MRPPTESLEHQLYKLITEAESHRDIGNSIFAPPSYSYAAPRMPSGPMDITMEDPTWDPQWDELTPITITVDNSIDVVGNDNKVIVPPRFVVPVANSNIQQDREPNNIDVATTSQASSRKLPASQVSQIATTIIAVLRRVDALTDESGRMRPINVSVKTGVKIQGCNNAVSTREALRPVSPHESAGTGLKRRASSVGLCLSKCGS